MMQGGFFRKENGIIIYKAEAYSGRNTGSRRKYDTAASSVGPVRLDEEGEDPERPAGVR